LHAWPPDWLLDFVRPVANSGPQVLAPAIAAPLVSKLGGYQTLYLTVAAVTAAGSAFVWKIRSVP
jgi:hypothetical protein